MDKKELQKLLEGATPHPWGIEELTKDLNTNTYK